MIAPVQLYAERPDDMFSGLILLRPGATSLTEVGRIAGPSDDRANRSLVIGDRVYLLTEQGLQAHDLDTLAEVSRVTF